MERRIQQRTDGLLFLTIPKHTGYSEGEILKLTRVIKKENSEALPKS